MDTDKTRHSLTPSLPTYPAARAFLMAMEGVSYATYSSMVDKIWEQVGTPQENMDWSDPETWVPQRLHGEEQALALKLWRETKGLVNPRHTRGCWYLTNHHDLICRAPDDTLEMTKQGQLFIKQEESSLVVQVDQLEGLLSLLQIVSEHNPGKRGEILPGFEDFCKTFTNYQGIVAIKAALYDRLINLIDRGLISRSGMMYTITDKGIAYLQKYAGQIPGRAVTSKQTEIQKLARSISQEALDQLSNYLSKMDPYKFEHLVQSLLEEMGYSNVVVTAPSNDKGVDVVADIELGISSVREVVQVKRMSGSINRVILDQLRGSLHRFKAMRGTIITIGTFSAGAKTAALEQGAAPITLIDGDKLLDLLTQYQIGISKKAIEFIEFDDTKLQQFEEESPALDQTEA